MEKEKHQSGNLLCECDECAEYAKKMADEEEEYYDSVQAASETNKE